MIMIYLFKILLTDLVKLILKHQEDLHNQNKKEVEDALQGHLYLLLWCSVSAKKDLETGFLKLEKDPFLWTSESWGK